MKPLNMREGESVEEVTMVEDLKGDCGEGDGGGNGEALDQIRRDEMR